MSFGRMRHVATGHVYMHIAHTDHIWSNECNTAVVIYTDVGIRSWKISCCLYISHAIDLVQHDRNNEWWYSCEILEVNQRDVCWWPGTNLAPGHLQPSFWHTSQCWWMTGLLKSVRWNGNIIIPKCTGSCQNDKSQCSQWLKKWHFRFSVGQAIHWTK